MNFRAVAEVDLIRAAEQWVYGDDAGGVDDTSAVDAHELMRIEASGESAEGLGHQELLCAAMKLDVVVCGFDPFDGVDGDHVKALAERTTRRSGQRVCRFSIIVSDSFRLQAIEETSMTNLARISPSAGQQKLALTESSPDVIDFLRALGHAEHRQ